MRQCPVLMYHWFTTDAQASVSRSPQLEITPALFERQMRYLHAAGYRTVSLQQAIVDRTDLPERPIVITFDDGTRDFWEHARPCLDACGFTATLFVVTEYVGGQSTWDAGLGEPSRPLLSWDQIVELDRAGYEIGSHTHTHRPLTTLDADEARAELSESRRTLTERLGRPPAFLAYPRGFHAAEHTRLAREVGYAGACAVILRWRDLRRADRFDIRRMTIKGTESMGRFRMRVALAGIVPMSAEKPDATAGG